MRRRILYLTPGVFDKGGISRYGRYQIAALRRFAEVRVLSLVGPNSESFEDPFEVFWHGTRPRLGDRMAMAFQSVTQTMAWRPHLVHAAHVNLTPLAGHLARFVGAATVLNVYGRELWSGLSKRRRCALYRCDHIIADCYATADHLRHKAMHPDPATVIWDCVDLDRFCPGASGSGVLSRYGIPYADQSRLILSLGRLARDSTHKGFDRLIKAFSALNSSDALLVIAGHGDDRPRLEALAKQHSLGNRCIFTGPLADADLPALYRAARVFALVSDKGPGRGEGLPLTPIEALACGVPVIVGNEDGSCEAVDGTRNGRVISPRDPCSYVAALGDLLAQPEGAARKAARQVAEERFGFDSFSAKHRDFYEQIAVKRL